MAVTAPQILEKQPSETRTYSMLFNNLLATGETISSITSVTSELRGGGTSDLTISGETISGTAINFSIAGGTHGKVYRIEVKVVTSASETLEGDGILSVSDH